MDVNKSDFNKEHDNAHFTIERKIYRTHVTLLFPFRDICTKIRLVPHNITSIQMCPIFSMQDTRAKHALANDLNVRDEEKSDLFNIDPNISHKKSFILMHIKESNVTIFLSETGELTLAKNSSSIYWRVPNSPSMYKFHKNSSFLLWILNNMVEKEDGWMKEIDEIKQTVCTYTKFKKSYEYYTTKLKTMHPTYGITTTTRGKTMHPTYRITVRTGGNTMLIKPDDRSLWTFFFTGMFTIVTQGDTPNIPELIEKLDAFERDYLLRE